MGILSWIIVGAVAGLLARLILRPFMPEPILTLRGIAGAILVGIIGAIVGGFLAGLVGIGGGGTIWTIIIATIGAIILLAVYLSVKGATVRTYRGNADTGRLSQRDNLAANAEPRRTPEEPQRLRQSEEPRKQETKGIFISYRRDESAGYAGRIADKFSEYFGEERVFRDIDSIEPGLDFAEAIESAVGSSEVLVAVIGRNWLTVEDTAGHKRLENPDDFVRLEIAAALKRNIRVIPLLVQGASMPGTNELPDDLAPLGRRNAFELHDSSWTADIQRLIRTLERVIER
jgi:uncharacterized membrane protein YeaQ/YmgE (transglycosylase-associated protein family)